MTLKVCLGLTFSFGDQSLSFFLGVLLDVVEEGLEDVLEVERPVHRGDLRPAVGAVEVPGLTLGLPLVDAEVAVNVAAVKSHRLKKAQESQIPKTDSVVKNYHNIVEKLLRVLGCFGDKIV